MNIQGKMIFDETTKLYAVALPLLGLWTQGTDLDDGLLMAEDALKMLYPDVSFVLQWTDKETGVFYANTSDKKVVPIILKEGRLAADLSLMEAAKKLGYSNQNSIHAYERGAREPSISKFHQMLQVYGVSIYMHVDAQKKEAA
jgi:DNA-binding XRE family transcriptional regulator